MSKKTISALLLFLFSLPFICSGHAATAVTTLLPINASSNNGRGFTVEIDGDYLLCGAPLDDDDGEYAGAAYVYKKTNSTWTQTAKLKPSDGSAGRAFGHQVSLDGDYAVVGCIEPLLNTTHAGSVYIFHRVGETWTQSAKITPQTGTAQGFGSAISLHGDRLLIGEYEDSDISGMRAGVAYIYQRTGNIWSETARLLPSDLALWDYFGLTVALYDDYAFIGSLYKDEHLPNTGAVYVFKENGGNWSEVAKLTDPTSTTEGSLFGSSLDLYGHYAVIGSGSSSNDSGAAYIYEESGGTWVKTKKLVPSNVVASQRFGHSASLTDQYAIIGALGDPDAAYLFQRNGSDWIETEKLTGSLVNQDENFGFSVSCQNSTFVIGAPNFFDNSQERVYIYEIQQAPPPPVTGYTYYLPGFNTEGGNWTGVGLTNRESVAAASVNVNIFSNQGVLLRTEPISIAGGGQKASAIGSGLAAQGWVQLDSSMPLAGLCFIGSSGLNSGMADVPVSETLESNLVVPHIAQNNLWDTTLMVCNPNDNAIDLQIIYRDTSGNVQDTRTYRLPAFGSEVYPLADIFSGLIPLAGSITLQGSPGIAAFALYSNLKTGGKSFAGINAVATQ